ncbi:transcription-repair coupling factor [Nocardia asteroides NBRC 15531]|uniref:Transcription-repair-coupling factor n=1 Tax=Nocardia asteroides NBRC 15531 TaxID=1110697 RepID=U5EFQ0_NOCAS|nr:transcription-repair coupling factor [Nocardia asteroides]TLF69911.1 transcription-repair coupling factor [Nocardia asteroides NBRC 15531]UGT49417.1 transcription-repair coupling factor [Nocardia asteroides]SFL89680.1 transcription-repair coupling factor (superfamily II helicase) [Nocardia asteroides]VEG38062.1 Transcription-repair-coupling factor [Nocardia asteroides]GAD84014.1 transcription-repair coupling factor [Nocardia asteroides NBRC 15531]
MSSLRPPLAGLAEAAGGDAALRTVADLVGKSGVELVAPSAVRPFVAQAVAAQRPLVVVTATGREADDLTVELAEMLGPSVAQFPSWETLPHERLSPGPDTVGRRLEVLRRLAHPEDPVYPEPLRVVVTTVRSLMQPMTAGLGDIEPIVLRTGADYDFDELLTRLVEFAYTRVDMVGKRGEFAVRGGILDLFPPTADHPVRVEFWGDEVTELRPFSVADQRSLDEQSVELVVAPPCRELLLTAPVRERAAAVAADNAADAALVEMLDKIAEGIPVDGMEALLPVLAPGHLSLLTEALPAGTHLLLCDPEKIRTRAADLVRTGEEFLEASWTAASFGSDAPLGAHGLDLAASGYRSLPELHTSADELGLPWWTLSPLSSGDPVEVNLPVLAGPTARGSEELVATIFASLRAHVATGGRAVVVVTGHGTAQRILERLADAEVPASALAAGAAPEPGVVGVLCGSLHDGVIFDDAGLVVVAESDLTGNRVTAPSEGKRLPAKRRNQVDPLALSAGDMVVHDQHGIGRFVEMIERTVGGARREYLVIEYAPGKRGQPGDRLFVPMESLDQLSRYVGGELPSLSKLGGSDWANTKRKARKAVREIAGELVQLYAARQAAPGHAFAPDTPWQQEMEDAFAFTETVDQMTAITDVKADMEKAVPMDRVVCGDVGYGKTEIAVRAAFKAVQDGKQVVVLVPTTLLAQQHLQTFTERVAGFPVTVKGLSRFTDAAESKEIMAGMAEGEVDIVVGTHRLLQTGVRWKDLGLVIVDEEQRFGVEHKEHIKALRTHVDVLTMSATPIPRTLEMSLAGIREMSTILTPPEERHPVLTYVGAYNDKQVTAAIRRELMRDGQVFYVHNRVSSIDKAAKRIRDLVPEARVVVAHGQMNEDQLERTVQGFWQREFDVLVCTTIIETGLDISNANTLIVERADSLGLSQLHQLRGRVGRSRERGYAYFLYPPEKPLTETAYDRLATIAQNSDLGAGMAVAMKDLEIRGAGNVLGAEQSGHVAGVGFDLYVRLVGEAVEAYRAAADGKPIVTEESKEVRIDLPVDAHIPPDYVASDRLRLEAYRKLAAAQDDAALAAVVEELVDRYGPLPVEVGRLVSVARLRLLARSYDVAEIVVTGTTLKIAPMTLPDSKQLRLKRLYPSATYRAASGLVQLPLPRVTDSVGAERVRDVAVLQFVADLLLALDGKPQGLVDLSVPTEVTTV